MSGSVAGQLTVSDDVLADLVGYALKEIYGVVGMSQTSPSAASTITGLLPGQRLRKGVEINHDDYGKLLVGIHVVLEHGVNINAVSHNVVDGVKFVLKEIAQIDDPTVEVFVDAMKVRES